MRLRKGLLRLAGGRAKAVTAAGLAGAGALAGYPGEVGESAARKLSAVDRCLEILSDSIGKLPNYVMDNATRRRLDHPLLELLNRRPNEAMTPFIRRKVLECSRLEGGNGYDWILRDPSTGAPRELIPVPWRLVAPWRDSAGRVWYTVAHPLTGEPMVLPNEDICHYKGATRDGLTGLAVLGRAGEVIAAARAAQQYGLAYYQSGGQPAGILKTDADLGRGTVEVPDGAGGVERLSHKDWVRREWEAVHAGPRGAHRVAILDLGLSYTPISATNRDAQFIEDKEIAVRDIARYFGVPLYKLQEGKQAYGSNEQNAIEYVVGTLHPIVAQYEEEQTWKLLSPGELRRGLEIRINLMAELKGDTGSRATWYRTMREIGGLNADEIRGLEDMGHIPGGEEFFASWNFGPLSRWAELSVLRALGGKAEKEGSQENG